MNRAKMEPKIGHVWMCDLSKFTEENSSIQRGKRPYLMLNILPSIASLVYICVPLTSVIKREDLPVHYVIEDWQEQGLRERSMVIGEQQFSLARGDLVYYVATVNDRTLYHARRVALFNNGINVREVAKYR